METAIYVALMVVVWILMSDRTERVMKRRQGTARTTEADVHLVEDDNARSAVRRGDDRVLRRDDRVRGRMRGPGAPRRGDRG